MWPFQYKAIGTGLFLSLILGGGDRREIPTPAQPPEGGAPYKQTSRLAEIVSPQKTATHYKTSRLAERALNLSEKLFPIIPGELWDVYRGAIYIGKDLKGSNRYAIVKGMRISDILDLKRLEVSVYAGLDSKLEAEVNEYLLNGDYKYAAEVLGKADSLIEFWDGGADGLKNFGERINIGSTSIEPPELSKDELRWVNDAYGYLLQEKIIPALERELEFRIIMQQIGKTDPRREQKEVERIRTALESLHRFVYGF